MPMMRMMMMTSSARELADAAVGFYESLGLLIPVIKAVISGDNGGREIAALVWVTYPPAMNPRVARRRLMFPQSIPELASFLGVDPSAGMMKSRVKTRTPRVILRCRGLDDLTK